MSRGLHMTLQQAKAHADKHGHTLEGFVAGGIAAQKAVDALAGRTERRLPTPVKMTRPEKQYDLMLKSMKSKGEILDYKFQGLSLAWGEDPRTGRLMRYKADFVVFPTWHPIEVMDSFQGGGAATWLPKIIEVKGSKVTQEGMARFKGCRAEWPQFDFEMHQLKAGEWKRIQ